MRDDKGDPASSCAISLDREHYGERHHHKGHPCNEPGKGSHDIGSFYHVGCHPFHTTAAKFLQIKAGTYNGAWGVLIVVVDQLLIGHRLEVIKVRNHALLTFLSACADSGLGSLLDLL